MARTGNPAGLVVVPGEGIAVATAGRCWAIPTPHPAEAVAELGADLAPRWVWWSASSTASALVSAGVRPSACWDLAAVHRLLRGGTADDPARVWAAVRGLPAADIPRSGQLDLFGAGSSARPASAAGDGSPEEPVRPDGYLRPEWAEGSWTSAGSDRVLRRGVRWAELALEAQAGQRRQLERLPEPRAGVRVRGTPLAVLTAWAESAAELLAVELAYDGLPVERGSAEALVRGYVGDRPADAAAAERARRERDDEVRRHLRGLDSADSTDLRNPQVVRALLLRVGIDVPDTRSWRLERHRGAHPLVEALLTWRKAERIATTYGYGWLDRHVHADGRLRGAWSGSDGAAGRMTAQAGLHNLPAELRPAVVAEEGHVFVRADLGQIEPRVLAVVSGDAALAAAAGEDDLYSPVAAALGCDRPTAKVAVLAAMYGQTSGTAGQALRRMERAYPVAMAYLRRHDEAGRSGRDVRTYGGRLVRVGPLPELSGTDAERGERAAVASRGRFARNAVVQGAAAELFKMWAVTVRAKLQATGGSIVLCLHDELLLHVPVPRADDVVAAVHRALDEAAGRWASGRDVRFVADVTVVRRWSDAKPEPRR